MVNQRGYCRLCCRQATLVRDPHQSIDLIAANRTGQQLFIVDLLRQKHDRLHMAQALRAAARSADHNPLTHFPATWRQERLFDPHDTLRDLATGRARGLPNLPLPGLAAALQNAVAEHAAQNGWGRGMTAQAEHVVRVLLCLQDTPGAAITISETVAVARMLPNGGARAVQEVLAPLGMLIDDRAPTLQGWFTDRADGLPEPMIIELQHWLGVMRDGSTTAPRSKPRAAHSIYSQLTGIIPAAHQWAAAGHQTLRSLTPQDIRAVLPADAVHRHLAVVGLRSLFRILKAHRIVFTDPARRLRQTPYRPTKPLPADLDDVIAVLDSDAPVQAALAAIITYHALRNRELRELRLSDLHDGRIHLSNRTVLLATPARTALSRWLDDRARRWPNTINPHAFVNHYTAVRTTPVSSVWIRDTLGMPVSRIRDDRILAEALATEGDARRLSDLFGLNIASARRYTHITEDITSPS